MRAILRLMLVLTTTCFVAALALSQVYQLTEEPIAHQKRLEVLRAIRAVMPNIDNEPDKDVIRLPCGKISRGECTEVTFFRGRVSGELAGVAFIVESREGYGGRIEIMLGVDPRGRILGIEILSHLETPGLGEQDHSEAIPAAVCGKEFEKHEMGRPKGRG